MEGDDGSWEGIDGAGDLRFLNHSRSPNVVFDGPDLYALRDVSPRRGTALRLRRRLVRHALDDLERAQELRQSAGSLGARGVMPAGLPSWQRRRGPRETGSDARFDTGDDCWSLRRHFSTAISTGLSCSSSSTTRRGAIGVVPEPAERTARLHSHRGMGATGDRTRGRVPGWPRLAVLRHHLGVIRSRHSRRPLEPDSRQYRHGRP